MRMASWIAASLFLLSALAQWNDPDPIRWIALYLGATLLAVGAARGQFWLWPSTFATLIYLATAAPLLPSLRAADLSAFTSFGMSSLRDEEAREALGMLICAGWSGGLALRAAGRRRARRRRRGLLLPLVVGALSTALGGCAALAPTPATLQAKAALPITSPLGPEVDLRPRTTVASGLANPRGMLARADGSLLVALAGTGDSAAPGSGALVELTPPREGRRSVRPLLIGQESTNLVALVRRDEVFGLAGISAGDDTVLLTLARFGGPSHVLAIEGQTTRPWAVVHGNINDMTWDPRRRRWYGVSSSHDEILILTAGARSRRFVKLPPLAQGQDAVPGYLEYDPTTDRILVSLFTGSPLGEEGGTGTDIIPGAGKIIAVDPDSGDITDVVTGLTAPTDLALDSAGKLHVLEISRDFVDAVESRQAMLGKVSHGGFRRFSGRLLRIDRQRGSVTVLADDLDAPTNLAWDGAALLVAQGMGTPERLIPRPDGSITPLDGVIERIELPAHQP